MLSTPPNRPHAGPGAPAAQALLCFSHLRWSFVWQRPQHLLTRFAAEMPVYVVEEPEFAPGRGADGMRVTREAGVTVLTPILAREANGHWGFNDHTNPRIARLVARAMAGAGPVASDAELIVWYYTPMAWGALPTELHASLTIFDAMDELAQFAGAPAGLRAREADLMRRADLVFTGGPSLYRTRADRHPRVHCFPSGVDAAHFARARDITRLPADLADLPAPVLGFYGVLDERLDRELVAGIADARPDWTLVLIGPIAKITPDDLPHRPNIVYPGKRTYEELPGYLAGFNAAILPFARNEATAFISPTKTLEYMAAGKPIVSAPIRDVIDLYGDVVEFGSTPAEIVAAVEGLWAETPAERARRERAARRLLAEHDWNVIADRMLALMHERRVARVRSTAVAPMIAALPFGESDAYQFGVSD